MSRLNDRIARWVHDRARTSCCEDVVARILPIQRTGVPVEALRSSALAASRDVFVRSGRKADREQVALLAHLALAEASLRRPYQGGGLPEGTDKAHHAWLSGTLSAWVAEQVSRVPLMPGAWSRAAGVVAAMGAGVLKEVLDIGGTGFNPKDIRADWIGARSAISRS